MGVNLSAHDITCHLKGLKVNLSIGLNQSFLN